MLFLLITLAEIMYSEDKKVSSCVKKVSEKDFQNKKNYHQLVFQLVFYNYLQGLFLK